jgi:hypothetical protein
MQNASSCVDSALVCIASVRAAALTNDQQLDAIGHALLGHVQHLSLQVAEQTQM